MELPFDINSVVVMLMESPEKVWGSEEFIEAVGGTNAAWGKYFQGSRPSQAATFINPALEQHDLKWIYLMDRKWMCMSYDEAMLRIIRQRLGRIDKAFTQTVIDIRKLSLRTQDSVLSKNILACLQLIESDLCQENLKIFKMWGNELMGMLPELKSI